jgi:hypothetical protein
MSQKPALGLGFGTLNNGTSCGTKRGPKRAFLSFQKATLKCVPQTSVFGTHETPREYRFSAFVDARQSGDFLHQAC